MLTCIRHAYLHAYVLTRIPIYLLTGTHARCWIFILRMCQYIVGCVVFVITAVVVIRLILQPLLEPIMARRADIVQDLFLLGADPEQPSNSGDTAHALAAGWPQGLSILR